MSTVVLAGGGTGGHLFPALAIGRALGAADPSLRIIYGGAERGIEARVLPERGVAHRLFPFQPLYRRAWWRNLGWPGLALRLRREIDAWLEAETPDLVIGTGGYASAPLVWRAARRGIATAILELDVRPGLATRLVAPRVDAIWLATEEGLSGLTPAARERAVVTGAPIQPPDLERRSNARARFGFEPGRPVVVVTGGSQGSVALNRVVAQWIAAGGARDSQIIWATGVRSHAEFVGLHRPPHVQVLDFIEPMADAWALADLAITRAGMMTLAELAGWAIPGILVPLPSAAADHQTHNARAAEASGAAVMVPQAELDVARLNAVVGRLLDDSVARAAMRRAARRRGRPDAAAELARRALALVDDAGLNREQSRDRP